jgi:hypothetical protein
MGIENDEEIESRGTNAARAEIAVSTGLKRYAYISSCDLRYMMVAEREKPCFSHMLSRLPDDSRLF